MCVFLDTLAVFARKAPRQGIACSGVPEANALICFGRSNRTKSGSEGAVCSPLFEHLISHLVLSFVLASAPYCRCAIKAKSPMHVRVGETILNACMNSTFSSKLIPQCHSGAWARGLSGVQNRGNSQTRNLPEVAPADRGAPQHKESTQEASCTSL